MNDLHKRDIHHLFLRTRSFLIGLLLLPVDFPDQLCQRSLRLCTAVREGEEVFEDRVDAVDGFEFLAERNMFLSLSVERLSHHLDKHVARFRIFEHKGGQVSFLVEYRHYGYRALRFVFFHKARIFSVYD